MTDQRNWLERLADKIPGYAGYAAKDRRRDVDKMHREHLADRLRGAKQFVTDAVRGLTDAGRLFEVGPLDRSLKKMDQAENRIRFASYGYAGFFDTVKIEEPQLEAIYRFDLALTEKVEEAERRARELSAGAGDAGGLKEASAGLERALDDLNRAFDERYRAIENFKPGDAPGQPMFG